MCGANIEARRLCQLDTLIDGRPVVGLVRGHEHLGLFADAKVNEAITKEGLFFGGGIDLLAEQLLSIVVVLVFSFVVTTVIARVLDAVMGLRVDEEEELTGLDQSEHAETAYNLASSGFHMDRVH